VPLSSSETCDNSLVTQHIDTACCPDFSGNTFLYHYSCESELFLCIVFWQGENRLTHSLCKTILSVEEIIQVLNTAGIDNNVKKPFMAYLQTVYLGSVFQTAEIGTADLAHSELVKTDARFSLDS
jgi:hypothetical protein